MRLQFAQTAKLRSSLVEIMVFGEENLLSGTAEDNSGQNKNFFASSDALQTAAERCTCLMSALWVTLLHK